ncbi:uncharacterized protein LOC144636259 [Oculina patagonica]
MKYRSLLPLLPLFLLWFHRNTAAEIGCERALGVESGAILDSQMSVSSAYNNRADHGAAMARLHGTNGAGCWLAGTHDANQWLQVDLLTDDTKVTGVATQGRYGDHMWVTKYKLEYHNEGASPQFYREQGQNADKEFDGNTDRLTAVYHELYPPITARYIKFRPVTWNSQIAMRVELYDCSLQECNTALGMISGEISDEQISASSQYDDSNSAATKGRLRLKFGAESEGGWVVANGETNVDQWLQIDLLSQNTKVTGVATQGRDNYNHWVKTYKLQYSNNEVNFQYFREQNADKEFAGNRDSANAVYNGLNPPIRARYIRFRPMTWNAGISMRVEMYGCIQEILDFCFNNAVGIANPDVIPDDHMTATSQLNETFQPAYGRLYGDRGDGWCAKEPNRTDDWLQVDLGKTVQVCAVATQGDRDNDAIGSAHEWVTDFKLSYSANGSTWTTYIDGTGTEIEFQRKGDSTTVDRHKLPVPVSARYIRFRPTRQQGWNCLRVEVYSIEKCQEALGIESGLISDDKLSASSEYNVDQAANRGRLHIQYSGGKTGGWVAGTSDANQWLQVDLGSQYTKVTRVATQGRNDYAHWVFNYTLQYSNNGVNFQNYREQGQNEDKEFAGNTDQDTVVYHVLNPPITARYFRFRPMAWYEHISMRVELYGCLQDSCRSLNFHSPVDGHALRGHVFKNISLSVGMRSSCRGRCTMESICVSFNTGPPINDQVMCQLSDSDHTRHPEDLKPREGFTYRGTENACSSNPCFHNATCLNGYTYKKYRCMCQTGFKGENCEIVARTCKELYDNNLAGGNKAYPLKMGSVILPVFCHMTDDLGDCGGGGWTLVMKIDGQKETFHYDSTYWSDKNVSNLLGGKTGFDGNETKLPTYWNTPFFKICLGMKISQQIRFIVMSSTSQVNSLYSLIADGQYRETSLGRDTWKSLIGPQGTLQTGCNREGFNPGCSADSSKARIGIIGSDVSACSTCDSRVGFGGGGYIDDTNTCGNLGPHSSDNGGKNIKAMGYILVQ